MTEKDRILPELVQALSDLKYEECLRLTQEAIDKGFSGTQIVLEGLSPGLREVGKKFEQFIYFLADLVYSAHIMNSCMKLVEPLLLKEADKAEVTGRVVVGTVEGDLHDIGKNLVIVLWKASGFEVHDLGVDTPASKFIEKVKEVKPDIFGMSSFLTTTAPYMKVVIDALKEEGLRDGLYILIGGPPTSQQFADEIDADKWCKDAVVGVNISKKFMEIKKQTIEQYGDKWWPYAREAMKKNSNRG